MSKILQYDEEARKSIYNGVEKLAKAVAVTLGPRGRNVVIDRKGMTPSVTKDGVTVAKAIDLDDPFENMGAQMVKEVATKTNDVAGDGTTTATVLASAIYRECQKNVTAGANPTALKRGIDKAVAVAVKGIEEVAKDITVNSEIAQIASISANNDNEIGTLIAEAMAEVGNDGVIIVEESKSMETKWEHQKGMQYDRGYISPYMATNLETMESVLENPYILLYEKRISNPKDLLKIMEKVAQQNRPLLVIAEDVDGEALAVMALNTARKAFISVATKAPGFGDRRKALLSDIAILTGGTVISEEIGRTLESIELSDLGTAVSTTIGKEKTTIIEGAGTKADIDARVVTIKNQIAETNSDYDKEKLQERLAKLGGGVAVISIGAATEVELKEKKFRVEDALAATRAAVEEGVVAGGGLALLQTQKAINALVDTLEGDEKLGARIISKITEAPMRMIANNAGETGDVVVEKAKTQKGTIGFNASTLVWEDLLVAGVIDPAKVVRTALQNAASVAGMLSTTEVLITDKVEPSGCHCGTQNQGMM